MRPRHGRSTIGGSAGGRTSRASEGGPSFPRSHLRGIPFGDIGIVALPAKAFLPTQRYEHCMQYRALGRTGLKVSEIGFGAWAIGGNAHGNSYGPTDDKVSIAAVRRAV